MLPLNTIFCKCKEIFKLFAGSSVVQNDKYVRGRHLYRSEGGGGEFEPDFGRQKPQSAVMSADAQPKI